MREFSGPNPVCTSCGCVVVETKHQESCDSYPAHLARTCRGCGFFWVEKTKASSVQTLLE